MIAVVAVAYGSQPPGLMTAEFSPAARSQVDAPATTSPPGGVGGAGAGRRSTTTTQAPATSAAGPESSASASQTTRVGRGRRCFGDPPRQTEDPLAPPCIATIFDGDNGGATARGVSSTEIRIGVPIFQGRGSNKAMTQTMEALFEHVNQHFELYGRRLVAVPVEGSAGDSVSARAHAMDVVGRDVFGVINANQDWGYPQAALPQTFANEGIVTIVHNLASWWTDRSLFDPSHPYLWSVYPSSEDVQRNLADFACRSLAGQPAAHAGDEVLRGATRTFGIVAIGQQVAPATRVLSEALAACTGATPTKVEWTQQQGGTSLQTGLNQMKSAGVTTLVCICETVQGYNNGPPTAHQAGYHPEWIFTPTQWGGNNDDEMVVQNHRANGSFSPPMRIGAGPKLLPMQARPWFQALQSIRPDLATGPDASTAWSMAGFYYEQLLVLASGIQAAGPQLSAESFAAGLMATQFPNPNAGQAPYWQPSAGFGPGDHSFYDDYYVAWWSDAAPALNYPASSRSTGSWCYVGQGTRFREGSFPSATSNVLFNAYLPCR